MKVKLARTAGFCMGVRRAVNKTLDTARNCSGPIYTLGPLIHNPQVVEMFASQGVQVAEDVPSEGTVVIRSHGVSPEVREKLEERGVDVVNATCPRVARVQGLVRSHHKRGFMVVLLGDPGHAEVEGIKGYAEGRAYVIRSAAEVSSLPDSDKVCLVAQTTQEREVFEEVARAMRDRFNSLGKDDLVVADTICDSTRNRQEEVRRLSGKVDAMVVVGGKESANTRRLADVAREAGVPGFRVETEDELGPGELSRFNVVGLTAGASTPNWMIRRVYESLQDISPRRTGWTMLKGAIKWMVMSNLYVALGAGALTLAAARMQERWPDIRIMSANVLFVFAVHTLTLMMDTGALSLNVPARARSFTRYRQRWILASIAALLVTFTLGFITNALYGVLLTGLALISLVYPVRIARLRRLPVRSLAEVPASKDVFMAAGWSFLIVILPFFASPAAAVSIPAAAAAFLMIGGLVFVRALLRDFRDIQADRMIGRETLPIALGTRRTRLTIYITLLGVGVFMVPATALGGIPSPMGYALLLPLAYAAACVPLFTRQTILQGFGAEFIIDAAFLIAGAAALVP